MAANGRHSSSQPASQGVVHDFLVFHCNHVSEDGSRCQQPLDEGWVTACSHVFCGSHAKAWFRNHDDCAVCRNGPVKLVRLDISRAGVRRRGRTALLGLNPPEIVRATEVALNFWLDQKLFELTTEGRRQADLKDRHKSLEEAVRTRLGEAESAARGLEAEHQRLKRRLNEASTEGRRLETELARLQKELREAESVEASRQSGTPDPLQSRRMQRQEQAETPRTGQFVSFNNQEQSFSFKSQELPDKMRRSFAPQQEAGALQGPARRGGSSQEGRVPMPGWMQEIGKASAPLFAGRAPSFLLSGSRPKNRRIT